MDHESIDSVTTAISTAGPLPALLAAAHVGLELVHSATRILLEDDPRDDDFPLRLTARTEAVEALDALSRAPSLPRPTQATATPPTPAHTDDDRQITDAIAALALMLAQTLVTAADRSSNPADKIACLDAALHIGRLHKALAR